MIGEVHVISMITYSMPTRSGPGMKTKVPEDVFGNARTMQGIVRRVWQIQPNNKDDTYEACMERMFKHWGPWLDETYRPVGVIK